MTAPTIDPVDPMSAARRWADIWQDAWPRHDAHAIAALYAADAVLLSHPFRNPHRGREGVREYVIGAFAEEDAVECSFAPPVVSGDRAAVEYRARIHSGGVRQTLAGVSLLRFGADGLVLEHRDYWSITDDRSAIEIVDYRPAWTDDFRTIGERLRAALGARALRIDHIGSTAVPGLAAKDVIDVQVTVSGFDEDLSDAMSGAGFTAIPHITADHSPPGMTLPATELEKRLFTADDDCRRTANVHVRVDGRFNQRYALLSRDYLRATPLAARAYGELKRALAGIVGGDREAYYAVKDPLFDILWAAAEGWAASSGWSPGPSDA